MLLPLLSLSLYSFLRFRTPPRSSPGSSLQDLAAGPRILANLPCFLALLRCCTFFVAFFPLPEWGLLPMLRQVAAACLLNFLLAPSGVTVCFSLCSLLGATSHSVFFWILLTLSACFFVPPPSSDISFYTINKNITVPKPVLFPRTFFFFSIRQTPVPLFDPRGLTRSARTISCATRVPSRWPCVTDKSQALRPATEKAECCRLHGSRNQYQAPARSGDTPLHDRAN